MFLVITLIITVFQVSYSAQPGILGLLICLLGGSGALPQCTWAAVDRAKGGCD